MKEIVTCSQMKALDNHTIKEMGIPSCVLMERAALKCVEEAEKIFGPQESVLVVCGCGNNGGDGIAIARMLHLKGIRTHIFLAGKEESMTEETALQWKIARNYHIPRVNNPQWREYTTIVDAIFGAGLSRPVEGNMKNLIHCMNDSSAKKIAVDIPSGIDGNTGMEMGIAFRADLTVTFGFRKRGLCFYPGRMYAGKTVVADIGIYRTKAQGNAFVVEEHDLRCLPPRRPSGNKGTFGKVLVVAGSEGMCGAAYLSAAAALKAGAGMVQIQTVEANRIPLQILLPEAMVSCTFTEEENSRILSWCDVVVIGPGLGNYGLSYERELWFLKKAGELHKPVILDADGLNLLALRPKWKEYLGEHVVVTPHIGEMSRLTGKTIGEIQNCMAETALSYAEETKTTCVLKDACTVTAGREGNLYLNLSGNEGMATAGSGDVLTGILAAVFCMYLDGEASVSSEIKAALGVYLHGRCGDIAAEKYGSRSLTATNLIEALPEAFCRKEEVLL